MPQSFQPPARMSGRSASTAAIAQLAVRRSHNPKVVSSILTRRTFDIPPAPGHTNAPYIKSFRAHTALPLLVEAVMHDVW
jgi:hypothetical protein